MNETITYTVFIVALLFCAVQAIRSKRLLISALWLAGLSATLGIFFYVLGAQQVAVIELSVGAGLVTVLFVFAINVAGDQELETRVILPEPVAIVLVLLCTALLIVLMLPVESDPQSSSTVPFAEVLWDQRGLDVLVQIVLIYSGVLGLIGILAETEAPLEQSAAREVAEVRDRDLRDLEQQSLALIERLSEPTTQTIRRNTGDPSA